MAKPWLSVIAIIPALWSPSVSLRTSWRDVPPLHQGHRLSPRQGDLLARTVPSLDPVGMGSFLGWGGWAAGTVETLCMDGGWHGMA